MIHPSFHTAEFNNRLTRVRGFTRYRTNPSNLLIVMHATSLSLITTALPSSLTSNTISCATTLLLKQTISITPFCTRLNLHISSLNRWRKAVHTLRSGDLAMYCFGAVLVSPEHWQSLYINTLTRCIFILNFYDNQIGSQRAWGRTLTYSSTRSYMDGSYEILCQGFGGGICQSRDVQLRKEFAFHLTPQPPQAPWLAQ
jgi:hypothetical protein